MSRLYKVLPVAGAVLAAALYLLWSMVLGQNTSVAESKLLVRPTSALQQVYAGQLDRYIANELGVLLSTDTMRAVAAKDGGVSATQLGTAVTATQEPGTDLIVVQVRGLDPEHAAKVAKLIDDQYVASVSARVTASTAVQLKALGTEMSTAQKQIDALSEKIADAVAAALRRTGLPNDGASVAPLESSQRSLLVAKYSDLASQQSSLMAQQQSAGSTVQVVQQPSAVSEGKRFSIFGAGAAALGGALLGLALAIGMTRFRPTVHSWDEVGLALEGHRWVALDSRVPDGLDMPNPAVDSLAVWLGNKGRDVNRVLIDVADFPGQDRVAMLLKEAAEKVHSNVQAEFKMRTMRDGVILGDAAGVIIPFKSGSLTKKQIEDISRKLGAKADVFVVES